jgi:hypothetical protein
MSNSKLSIHTWNILHIYHEINFEKETSKTWSNWKGKETERLTAILNRIIKLTKDNTLFLLQEVPGDLLTLFKDQNMWNIISYVYKRVPRIKNDSEKFSYEDPQEYLVILCSKELEIKDNKTIQFEDPGKACLGVLLNNLWICNVHMPFGLEVAKPAITSIEEGFTGLTSSKAIILGDMNITPENLEKILGKHSKVFNTKNLKYTQDDRKGKKIFDHGFSINNSSNFEVNCDLDEENYLSDHQLVSILV